jgi:hypothetical protein
MRTFSLRQAVGLMVGACLLTLLVPTSVGAAGSALTRITDGKGPVAKVDPSGNLAVGDGNGPLSVDGTVGVTGQVGVSSLPPVSGSVDARPARPAETWMNVNGTTLNAATSSRILYSGLANRRLNLTTFSASAFPGNAGSVTLNAQVLVGGPTSSCDNLGAGGFAAAERFTIVVPVGSTVVETFPSPLSWTQYGEGDDRFCVQVSGSGPTGWSISVLASGFLG